MKTEHSLVLYAIYGHFNSNSPYTMIALCARSTVTFQALIQELNGREDNSEFITVFAVFVELTSSHHNHCH